MASTSQQRPGSRFGNAPVSQRASSRAGFGGPQPVQGPDAAWLRGTILVLKENLGQDPNFNAGDFVRIVGLLTPPNVADATRYDGRVQDVGDAPGSQPRERYNTLYLFEKLYVVESNVALLSELRGPNVLCPQDLKLQKGSGKTLAELHSTAKSGTIVYLAKEMSLSLVVHNAPDCPRRNFTFRTDHPAQIHGETSATAGPDGVLRTASRKPLSMRYVLAINGKQWKRNTMPCSKWTSHLFFRLPNQAEQQAIQQMLSITNASFAPI